ncbi:MAG: MBL fold metallo-hydrolase [Pseudomonadota bacterium]
MSDLKTPFVNRRHALIGAAGLAAASLAAPRSVEAAAPMQGLLRPEVYRFKLGAYEVTVISDGAIQLDGPHPIFGQNTSAEEVQALAEANFLPPTRMEIGFTQTVVNTGEQVILFDAGNGAGRRPNAGHLRARLAAAGIAPEQVDIVAITHFHPDHIGGLMEDGVAAYPNASYRFPTAEFDFWSPAEKAEAEATARVGKLVQSNVIPLVDKGEMIAPGGTIAAGIEAIDSSGHTPGHTCYHIESEGKRLMVLGDVCNHYVVSLQRPDWHVRFDMDKEGAVAARKKTLGMIAADKIPFVGYHMPFPAVGYLEPLGEGFRWIPATYQLNL